MKPEYVIANDAERTRLNALLARLSDEDLARRLPNGLTVSATLLHLAFWDQYALAALKAWRQSGFCESSTNFEAVNSALQVIAGAVPDPAVIPLTREAADAVDREAEAVPTELAQVIEAGGKRRTLERAQHRGTHLDQIEGAGL